MIVICGENVSGSVQASALHMLYVVLMHDEVCGQRALLWSIMAEILEVNHDITTATSLSESLVLSAAGRTLSASFLIPFKCGG